MSQLLLPDGINEADYWNVQVEGVSWVYLITRLIEALPDPNPKDNPVIFVTGLGIPRYLLKKTHFPIEALSRMTGLSHEKLESLDMIALKETDKPGVPTPTVDYWGVA